MASHKHLRSSALVGRAGRGLIPPENDDVGAETALRPNYASNSVSLRSPNWKVVCQPNEKVSTLLIRSLFQDCK